MTADTAPRSALDGLVTCGRCGTPMSFEEPTEEHEALYLCRDHQDDGVQANTADRRILEEVLL